jgi:hypothetical protein
MRTQIRPGHLPDASPEGLSLLSPLVTALEQRRDVRNARRGPPIP